MQTFDLLSIFGIALSMSLGHCIGMCGGIVIAYSNAKIDKNASNFYQIFSHVLYSLGRITSYIIIGAICAYIGRQISVSMDIKGLLFIIIGLFLILFAFLYMFFPKTLAYLEPSISRDSKNKFSKFFQSSFVWLMGSKNLYSFYGLGILNGFLPCGMVYFFAASAALASSVLMGIATMATFGFATFFPLFVLGFFTSKLLESSFRRFFVKLSFVLMLCFGGYSVYKGILMLNGKSMHSMGHHQNTKQEAHSNHLKEVQ